MLTLKKSVLVIFLLVTAISCLGAEEVGTELGSAPIGGRVKGAMSYPPSEDGRVWPAADPDAINKWQDMRFGMFIHWGPVALTGHELSWSRGTITPIDEYDQLYKRFNPTEFDADEWVNIAKAAGMKYMIITTMHHDGFCLWPSKYTDHDIAATPFKRDPIKELANACRRQGLKFGIYYSPANWYRSDYPGGPMPGQ